MEKGTGGENVEMLRPSLEMSEMSIGGRPVSIAKRLESQVGGATLSALLRSSLAPIVCCFCLRIQLVHRALHQVRERIPINRRLWDALHRPNSWI